MVPYDHPAGGFSLGVPSDWDLAEYPYPGVAVLLRAPQTASEFRTNALVTVDTLEAGMTLRDWQGGADALLPQSLNDYFLIDLEHVDLHGVAGVRRLAHHTAPGGHAVTMEQWAVLAGSTGYTLTASVATLDYLAHLETLSAVAAAFRIHANPA